MLGICGGYQMLGARISDLVGAEAEAGTVETGINLLPVETVFEPARDKITVQSAAQVHLAATHGLFALLGNEPFRAYQIHAGRTVANTIVTDDTVAFRLSETETDGWLRADGWCAGCYLHGLFENDLFRHGVLSALLQRRNTTPTSTPMTTFNRQSEYDKLAALLRTHLNLDLLKALCDL